MTTSTKLSTRKRKAAKRKVLIADLFCGAGGSSTGAKRALSELDIEMILVCINHWPIAIETHRKNHPSARHYIEDVTLADPEVLVPEGYLDLLMASPECRFYSRARGGKPVYDQARMNPWAIQRWLTTLNVKTLLVENVPEFVEWGPLNDDGKPDKSRKGLHFEAWIKSLWELGYTVEWKILNAADYGDATTRRRFFLQARKDGKPIVWPDPTHSKDGGETMWGVLPKWRSAKEIIDWEDLGRSLLDNPKYQKKPLALNTRLRIARGLQKYGGALAPYYINLLGLEGEEGGTGTPEGFTLQNRKNGRGRSLDEPISTITASNGGGGILRIEPLVEPFIVEGRLYNNSKKDKTRKPRDINEPLAAITGHGGGELVQPGVKPFIMANRSNNMPRDTEQPVHTITATNMGNLYFVQPDIEPFVLGQQSCSAARDTDQPLMTVAGSGAISLIDPQLVVFHGNSNTSKVDKPIPSQPTKSKLGIINPQILKYYGSKKDTDEIEDPLSTVTTKGRFGLINPLLTQVNHGDDDTRSQSLDEPLRTITAKRNIALIEPVLKAIENGEVDPLRVVLINGEPYLLDIRFRMLKNKELSRAMGLDSKESEYEFVGTIAQVTKQIGNAVPAHTAAALVKSIFATR